MKDVKQGIPDRRIFTQYRYRRDKSMSVKRNSIDVCHGKPLQQLKNNMLAIRNYVYLLELFK